jgi:hypothetical protein
MLAPGVLDAHHAAPDQYASAAAQAILGQGRASILPVVKTRGDGNADKGFTFRWGARSDALCR